MVPAKIVTEQLVPSELHSDGGDVASKAPLGLYAMALVAGVGVAAGASALVRAAGREHETSLALHA